MGRRADTARRRSSGLVFKSIIAAVLFVAGLVAGASGRATIAAPPVCDEPAATSAPATAGAHDPGAHDRG